MQQKTEINDTTHLFAKVNTLVDPVLQTIPEKPVFCFNSAKQFRLFDTNTLMGMRAAVEDCRALIHIIDTSGPTGIGYILTTLPESEDQAVIAGDLVLKAWHARFPMAKYLEADEEHDKQLQLYFHENKLTTIDKLFEQCAVAALPEEVRQIAEIEKQIQECQEELAELSEEEDDERIQEEIAQLQEQLDAAIAIRDNLNLDEVKEKAATHAQVDVAIAIAEQKRWSKLVNFDQSDAAHILNEEQFSALVSQAVDALVARNYKRLDKEELGPLAKHLAAYRELQNEKRFNAEGSLRTQADMGGDIHQLSLGEIRDPLDRTLFIDTITSSNGERFRDIIVGAFLSINQPLPTIIQEFIDQKMEDNEAYPVNAQQAYAQFSKGKLKLLPEQIAILRDFGLTCVSSSINTVGVGSSLEKFGVLKRARSADNLVDYERNKSAKLPTPKTP